MFPGRGKRELHAPWRGRGPRNNTNQPTTPFVNNNLGGGAPIHSSTSASSSMSRFGQTTTKANKLQTTEDSDSSDTDTGGAPLRPASIISRIVQKAKSPLSADIKGKNVVPANSHNEPKALLSNPQADQTTTNTMTPQTPGQPTTLDKPLGTNELLEMIRKSKPEFFDGESELSMGANLSRSQTFTDGFINEASTSDTHTQPQTVGTGVAQSRWGPATVQQAVPPVLHRNTLRSSRTEPSIGELSMTTTDTTEGTVYQGGMGFIYGHQEQSYDNDAWDANANPADMAQNIQDQIDYIQRMHEALQSNIERSQMALQNNAPQQMQSNVNDGPFGNKNHVVNHRRTQTAVGPRSRVAPRALMSVPEVDREVTPRPRGHPQKCQLIVAPQMAVQAPVQTPAQQDVGGRSEALDELLSYDTQTLANVMLEPRMFPFVENSSLYTNKRKEAGVLKITNCPFSVSRNEIIAIFGRAMRLLNDNEEPIHIILEKVTAKTLDAYAEFETPADALRALERIQENIAHNRPPRIGSRIVKVEFSNQAALMSDIFPVAHGVTWQGSHPMIRTDSPYPIDNFKCFTSEEENLQLSRHFECYGRTPFSRDCPERFIEAMISTLKKMPWYMTKFITIHQQHYIFESCQNLMCTLLDELTSHFYPYAPRRPGFERLTEQLWQRFIDAIMKCPGFTIVQKDSMALIVGMEEADKRRYNLPRWAESWTHLYSLSPKPGTPLDLLEFYIHVLRVESTRAVQNEPINVKVQLAELAEQTDPYFGYFWREINYPTGPAFDEMTLHHAANLEWGAMDRIIRRFLQNAQQNGNSFSSGIDACHNYSPHNGYSSRQITNLLME
ncbi:hypothetical protein PFICI_02918 [Pestalotiopsis fici W106-1]|uniref:RRM domain-containing protein n=1 Tax=Pestalotiopsis fici (strain W106-1 / CGMCC3.15140) TaxID=1229662 RepID=W3XFL6_PESFW|nr:uncharacterized protein PFICI_02918 [Pestalotiopsis fici W106-1]ETS84893.1 hypothetical protein PFICI_02918 [Pestalotiopsis fici W106-1]